MYALECDLTTLTLLEMEMFPGTCMVAIPFRTTVGLSAQVLPVDASECESRALIDMLQDSRHALSARYPDMALFGLWRKTAV